MNMRMRTMSYTGIEIKLLNTVTKKSVISTYIVRLIGRKTVQEESQTSPLATNLQCLYLDLFHKYFEKK